MVRSFLYYLLINIHFSHFLTISDIFPFSDFVPIYSEQWVTSRLLKSPSAVAYLMSALLIIVATTTTSTTTSAAPTCTKVPSTWTHTAYSFAKLCTTRYCDAAVADNMHCADQLSLLLYARCLY